jgi:pimeloyl-ACP methyl ester carboxylesterase
MTDQPAGGASVAQVNRAAVRYQRRGDGRPVVLLHPLRRQLEYLDPRCAEPGDAGVALIAVDLPGHGHSGAPAADYTAACFTDAAEALLDSLGVAGAIVAGESIGASIGLGLAARHCHRVAGIVALNPYDYGRRGGIRRSPAIGNIVCTSMLLPLIGPAAARAGTKGALRRVLDGGLCDPRQLSPQLAGQLYQSGQRPGHGRALRSLSRSWHSWISARDRYPAIQIPVTLAYGDHDWSNQHERDANRRAIPAVRVTTIRDRGHFSCLENPARATAPSWTSLPSSAKGAVGDRHEQQADLGGGRHGAARAIRSSPSPGPATDGTSPCA